MSKKILRHSKLSTMNDFKTNENKPSIDKELAKRLYDTEEYKQAKRVGIVLS
ncbi:5-formyltetrahydrofolate cyclo-ligase, partial [Staphylococcus gallinarum]